MRHTNFQSRFSQVRTANVRKSAPISEAEKAVPDFSWRELSHRLDQREAKAQLLRKVKHVAVALERYEDAADASMCLNQLEANDYVARLREGQEKAVNSEDFALAAKFSKARLQKMHGWWHVSPCASDVSGHVIHVVEKSGRIHGRAYSAAELSLKAMQQEDRAGEQADLGTPVFEVLFSSATGTVEDTRHQAFFLKDPLCNEVADESLRARIQPEKKRRRHKVPVALRRQRTPGQPTAAPCMQHYSRLKRRGSAPTEGVSMRHCVTLSSSRQNSHSEVVSSRTISKSLAVDEHLQANCTHMMTSAQVASVVHPRAADYLVKVNGADEPAVTSDSLYDKAWFHEIDATPALMPTSPMTREEASLKFFDSGCGQATSFQIQRSCEHRADGRGETVGSLSPSLSPSALQYVRMHVGEGTCCADDPLTGYFLGSYGSHGNELLHLQRGFWDGRPALIAHKITGDKHVPAGQVSFRVHTDGGTQCPENKSDTGYVKVMKGEGCARVVGNKSSWIDGELVPISNDANKALQEVANGAELGFVWSGGDQRRFVILLKKLPLATL